MYGYGTVSWGRSDFSITLLVGVPLYILGAGLTALILWYDSLCCQWCCTCCLGEAELVVFDPSHPEAYLVLQDGQVSNFTIK